VATFTLFTVIELIEEVPVPQFGVTVIEASDPARTLDV